MFGPDRLGSNMQRSSTGTPGSPEQREDRTNQQAPGAEPSTHHEVEFRHPYWQGYGEGDNLEWKRHTITCIASAEWPGLYHGVLDLHQEPIAVRGDRQVGTFWFPNHTGPVSHAFLFCGYEAEGAREHMRPPRFDER